MGVVARWIVPFLTVVGVTLAATPLQTGPAPGVRLVDSGNPIAGHNLYVDPTSAAMAAAEIANRLNQVGIGHARGFSLNTSNFFSTDEETGYGEDISGRKEGAHYVIDTSRNGVGPAPDAPLNWCNPSGRALGVPPTTATSGGHADAYLWVKRPGDSDDRADAANRARVTS